MKKVTEIEREIEYLSRNAMVVAELAFEIIEELVVNIKSMEASHFSKLTFFTKVTEDIAIKAIVILSSNQPDDYAIKNGDWTEDEMYCAIGTKRIRRLNQYSTLLKKTTEAMTKVFEPLE